MHSPVAPRPLRHSRRPRLDVVRGQERREPAGAAVGPGLRLRVGGGLRPHSVRGALLPPEHAAGALLLRL